MTMLSRLYRLSRTRSYSCLSADISALISVYHPYESCRARMVNVIGPGSRLRMARAAGQRAGVRGGAARMREHAGATVGSERVFAQALVSAQQARPAGLLARVLF